MRGTELCCGGRLFSYLGPNRSREARGTIANGDSVIFRDRPPAVAAAKLRSARSRLLDLPMRERRTLALGFVAPAVPHLIFVLPRPTHNVTVFGGPFHSPPALPAGGSVRGRVVTSLFRCHIVCWRQCRRQEEAECPSMCGTSSVERPSANIVPPS